MGRICTGPNNGIIYQFLLDLSFGMETGNIKKMKCFNKAP
jgi:hypothetical protein